MKMKQITAHENLILTLTEGWGLTTQKLNFGCISLQATLYNVAPPLFPENPCLVPTLQLPIVQHIVEQFKSQEETQVRGGTVSRDRAGLNG